MMVDKIREGFGAYSIGAAASQPGPVCETNEVNPFESTPI